MRDLNDVEILLVEDNPHDAEMTLRAFTSHRLANRVHHVTDGSEALAFLFRTGAYAARAASATTRLILLDLKLPKVDGLEVLRRVKSDDRTRMIPVVVLTSSNQEKDIVETYRMGVNSYIIKPVDFDKFVDAVKHLGLYWLLLNRVPGEGGETS